MVGEHDGLGYRLLAGIQEEHACNIGTTVYYACICMYRYGFVCVYGSMVCIRKCMRTAVFVCIERDRMRAFV